jgi:hypothetical protein
MLSVAFSYSYAECHYAEVRYAKCHYVEHRGAVMLNVTMPNIVVPLC